MTLVNHDARAPVRGPLCFMMNDDRADSIVWMKRGSLEPIVCDTSPISWQVFEAAEPVEMVDGKPRHSFRLGEPDVD